VCSHSGMGLQSRLDGFVRQPRGEGASTSGSTDCGWRKAEVGQATGTQST